MSTELDLSLGTGMAFDETGVDHARNAQLAAASAGRPARLNDLIDFPSLT
jgi:hypothetical protein